MYSITRSIEFDTTFFTLSSDFSRLSDLESAIDWFLARDPVNEKFVTKIEDDVYLWRTGELNELFPQLLILYRVDCVQRSIELIDLKIINDDF